MIDNVVDQVKGWVPVVVGTGEVGTDMTIYLARYAIDAGVDAAIICLPAYWRLREEDIVGHYKTVASAVDGPVFLHNIPSTTHIELPPGIVAELSELDNIIGIKESINDLEQIRAVIETAKEPFHVFVGMSQLLLDVLRLRGPDASTRFPTPCRGSSPASMKPSRRATRRGGRS